MHKIYTDQGKFDFLYNIPQIIFSSLISYSVDYLISYLSLSEQDIILIKKLKKVKKNKKIKKMVSTVLSRLSIKFGFFFPISFIILLLFGFYVTCFCVVYKNTQIHLITDSVISFCLSMVTPFLIYLLPGILRIQSLKVKSKTRKIIYKFIILFKTT